MNKVFRFICTAAESTRLPVQNAAVFTHVLQKGQLMRCCRDNTVCRTAVLTGSGECGSDPELIISELRRMNCRSLLADVESPAFAAELDRICNHENIELYVPAELFAFTEHSIAIECASITAGSYTERLHELRDRYGEKFAVDISPLRVEFTLPSDGSGRVLTSNELRSLLKNFPHINFSSDLRANYFIRSENGVTRLVIYDDAASLREKANIADEYGAKAVFLPYAEVCDIFSELI